MPPRDATEGGGARRGSAGARARARTGAGSGQTGVHLPEAARPLREAQGARVGLLVLGPAGVQLREVVLAHGHDLVPRLLELRVERGLGQGVVVRVVRHAAPVVLPPGHQRRAGRGAQGGWAGRVREAHALLGDAAQVGEADGDARVVPGRGGGPWGGEGGAVAQDVRTGRGRGARRRQRKALGNRACNDPVTAEREQRGTQTGRQADMRVCAPAYRHLKV